MKMNICVRVVAILLLQRIHTTVGDASIHNDEATTVRDLAIDVVYDGCESAMCWDNTNCEWISLCDVVVGEECFEYNEFCETETQRCTADSDCLEETEYCAQGTCLNYGRCRSSSDCLNPNNFRFKDKICMGYQYCDFRDNDRFDMVGNCNRKCGEQCENERQQERTQCSVTGCSEDTTTTVMSRCPGIVSCVTDYCDDNCKGIYFDASGSVLTDCTPPPPPPPPVQSVYDNTATDRTNTEQDPSLQDVYDALTINIDPQDFLIHDPSRIITVGKKQLIAVTGKAQEDGYTCGLETWWRKINKKGKAKSNWKPGQCLFQNKPDWVATESSNNDGAFWAPELDLKDDGTLTLLYSMSEPEEFGLPTTCVGIARSATGLVGFPDQLSWVDSGSALTCIIGTDYPDEERSAIDPSTYWGLGEDADRLFLVTGGGYIIATELDPVTYDQINGEWFDKERTDWTELARGQKLWEVEDEDYDWIEAAYIHANTNTNYYYLFVNWGACCSGLESTYEIRVGRSRSPLGPFVDKNGNNMMEGVGTRLAKSKGRVIGPGHPALWTNSKGTDFMSFHYYDKKREGISWIAERKVKWTDNGWPKLSKKTINTFPKNKNSED